MPRADSIIERGCLTGEASTVGRTETDPECRAAGTAFLLRQAVLLLAALVVPGGCSSGSQAVTYPAPLTGSSQTMVVRGQYETVALDRVEGVSLDDGKLTLRGSSASVALAPPASADLSRPTRNWALVTETSAGATRVLTFTHAETLDEFTLELPASEAQIYFGVFGGPADTEVMILTWGQDSRCFWGHVTIARAQAR